MKMCFKSTKLTLFGDHLCNLVIFKKISKQIKITEINKYSPIPEFIITSKSDYKKLKQIFIFYLL